MAKKTLYMVLGVPDNESPRRIHAAFRDLAKRLHPDVAGEGSTRAFQEVAEAHAVLSDPAARKDYNRRLGLGRVPPAGPRPQARRAPEPRVSRRGARGHSPFPSAAVEVEVMLDDDDVLLGCVVPLAVPALVPCPECGGRGRAWLVACGYCRQQGVIATQQLLRVRIPPMTPPGSAFDVLLPECPLGHLVVRLHVFHQRRAG
jgi:molecular chaperone DnaJ